ncbi:MAG: outer membrane beta-barrel protein [Saprospiraceae bacterium]|nr:outer membrane beta-barrel protein [Saprospiraceae bacterium]MCB0675488.1 outer membrane beta-barrel protein [Saprospiraceae bacterium]
MKRTLFLLPLIVFSWSLRAQYFEVGGQIGLSNYVGDLSYNSSALYLGESHFAAGVFGRFNINQFMAVKLGLNYGSITGRDENATDAFIRERNLSFKSSLVEVGLTGEFNIPGFMPYNLARPLSAYLFGGIGYTFFNPKAFYQGRWYDLQPLGTEGQGLPGFEAPYQKSTLVIPFGLGVKYALTDQLNIGLEIGARRAFTDYLDDVSGNYVDFQTLLAGNGELAAALGNRTGEYLGTEPVLGETGQRGDDKVADWYFLAGLSLSWNFLDNGLVGSRGRSTKRSGCKTY